MIKVHESSANDEFTQNIAIEWIKDRANKRDNISDIEVEILQTKEFTYAIYTAKIGGANNWIAYGKFCLRGGIDPIYKDENVTGHRCYVTIADAIKSTKTHLKYYSDLIEKDKF